MEHLGAETWSSLSDHGRVAGDKSPPTRSVLRMRSWAMHPQQWQLKMSAGLSKVLKKTLVVLDDENLLHLWLLLFLPLRTKYAGHHLSQLLKTYRFLQPLDQT